MNITLLCSDDRHPVNAWLVGWADRNAHQHQVSLVRRKQDLLGGDLLFLVSCSEVIGAAERARYKATLVLHASDLPRGRGWSPHIWEILAGADHITLTLLEAADKVDSGRVWRKQRISIPKHALWDEINARLFEAEIALIDAAVRDFASIEPVEQDPGIEANYYRRRTPADSRIDPHESIEAQFDLIRVCDPVRYPAYFDLHGHRYRITLEKFDGPPDPD
ncbi:MAG: hypothetical protein OJF60_000835 [Burkholderiaceae bacterium]|jgi:methionyl-tRNA formyltransferase|nr:MAG: hypothetical protein OJF60_000835 [Burkholderiaceae bacterium]